MSYHEEVLKFMESLQIATPLMVAKCLNPPAEKLHSVRVQVQREMNKLVELNQLEKKDKHYVMRGCKSEGGVHALAVSEVISQIYSRFPNASICREKSIEEKSIRPDVMAFAQKDGRGLCFIVEVVLSEDPNYTLMKRRVWEMWAEARQYLSQLFNATIPHFDFLESSELELYWEEMGCAG